MAGTVLIMLLVVACALGVAALAAVGSTNALADRYPRTAAFVATMSRHLNGEGEPPKQMARLFRA